MKVLLLLPVAAVLAAQTQHMVSFGKEVFVPPTAVVEEVVSIGGPVRVEGQVRQSVVAIGGPVTVEGMINDDLVVLGSATLGPKAVVDGEVVVIGGELHADPGARIHGDRTAVGVSGRASEFLGGPFAWLGDWLRDGLGKLRPIPAAHPWAWGLVLFFVLAYALLAAAAPKPVEACAAVLERQPAQALLAGVLAVSFLGPIALLFVISVVGIALIPALVCVSLLGLWFGKAGLLLHWGRRVWSGDSAVKPAVCVAAAGLVLSVLCALPGVGLAVWALASAWGLGAGLLAGIESASSQTSSLKPGPASPAPAAVSAAPREELAVNELDPVGFWPRAAAFAIDFFAVAVIAGILPVITFNPFAWAVYHVGLWTWKGTTLGGMVMGLRGVRVDGRPMDASVALVRHLASYLSIFPCFLGYLWAAWDPEGRTWHDRLAGTMVVKAVKAEALV